MAEMFGPFPNTCPKGSGKINILYVSASFFLIKFMMAVAFTARVLERLVHLTPFSMGSPMGLK